MEMDRHVAESKEKELLKLMALIINEFIKNISRLFYIFVALPIILNVFQLPVYASGIDVKIIYGTPDDIMQKLFETQNNSGIKINEFYNQSQTGQNGMAELFEAAFTGDIDKFKQSTYKNVNINIIDVKMLEHCLKIFESYKPYKSMMKQICNFNRTAGSKNFNFDAAYDITILVIKRVIAYYKGDYCEAERLMKSAVEVSMAGFGHKSMEAGIQLNNLANFYMELHRYEDADYYLRKALDIFQNLPGDESYLKEAAVRFNLGATFINKRKIAEGKQYIKEAFKIVQKFKDNIDAKVMQVSFLSEICSILKKEGKYDSIIKYLELAKNINIEIFGNKMSPEYIGNILDLANAYYEQGKIVAAQSLISEAVDLFEKIQADTICFPNIALQLGELFYNIKDYKNAEKYYEKGMKSLQSMQKGSFLMSDSLIKLGLLYYESGDMEKALTAFENASQNLEMSLLNIVNYESRNLIYNKQNEVVSAYLNTLNALMRKGKLTKEQCAVKAFSMMELARARNFMERLSESFAVNTLVISTEELNLINELNLKENNFMERLLYEKTGKSAGEQTVMLESEIEKIRFSKKELLKTLNKKHPELNYLTNIKFNELGKLPAETLKTGETVLSLWNDARRLFVCAADDRHFDYYVVEYGDISELCKDITRLNKIICGKIEDIDLFKNISYRLYENLYKHVFDKISPKNSEVVYVIMPMSMPAISLETILYSKKGTIFSALDYLLKRYNFAYIPSLKTLNMLRNLKKRSSETSCRRALLIGDPIYELTQTDENEILSDNFKNSLLNDEFYDIDSLFYSKYEIECVKNLLTGDSFSVQIYTGSSARESILKNLSYKGLLYNYKFAHFATHGFLSDAVAGLGEPCIALSLYGDTLEDGLLKMSEIYSLKIDADLVVLSACNTGIEQPRNAPQGISELVNAFLCSGSSSVIASRWNLNDKSNAIMIKYFYENVYKNKLTFLKSLSNAKLKMSGDFNYSHPYYWAPLIFWGDDYEL